MNETMLAKFMLQLITLVLLFLLAWKYDGYFIGAFFVIGGGIMGINIPFLKYYLGVENGQDKKRSKEKI